MDWEILNRKRGGVKTGPVYEHTYDSIYGTSFNPTPPSIPKSWILNPKSWISKNRKAKRRRNSMRKTLYSVFAQQISGAQRWNRARCDSNVAECLQLSTDLTDSPNNYETFICIGTCASGLSVYPRKECISSISVQRWDILPSSPVLRISKVL